MWSQSDRLARLVVEWDTDPAFPQPTPRRRPRRHGGDRLHRARRPRGPARPAGASFYRVVFSPTRTSGRGEERARRGILRHRAGAERADVFLAWSGDTAGQGWGINLAWGGMKIYEAMRRMRPDVFIHCGDQIYADNPILPEVRLHDGTIWKNVTTPAKSKVAETLAEFRGNFAYNLLDANVRRFNAEVASFVEWDDHEIHNNWYPGQILEDDRYAEKRASVLAERARRAMMEYTPDAPRPRRSAAHLPIVPPRPLARGVHARRAQLPRPEQREPPARRGPRDGLPRPGAGRVAEGRARRHHRDVEGARERHAARPRRPRRA